MLIKLAPFSGCHHNHHNHNGHHHNKDKLHTPHLPVVNATGSGSTTVSNSQRIIVIDDNDDLEDAIAGLSSIGSLSYKSILTTHIIKRADGDNTSTPATPSVTSESTPISSTESSTQPTTSEQTTTSSETTTTSHSETTTSSTTSSEHTTTTSSEHTTTTLSTTSSEAEETTESETSEPEETSTTSTTSSTTSSQTTTSVSRVVTTMSSVDNGRTVIITQTSTITNPTPTSSSNEDNNNNSSGLSQTNRIVVGVVVGVGGSILIGIIGVLFYLRKRNSRDYENGGWTFWRKNEKVGSDEFFNGELGVRDRNINQGSNF